MPKAKNLSNNHQEDKSTAEKIAEIKERRTKADSIGKNILPKKNKKRG